MSTDIISGATTDLWTVDPLSKAGRVTLYDVAGNPLSRNKTFHGAAEIEVRQSAATGAGAVVWAIHNPNATTKVYIQRIMLRAFFDGTSAATLMKYEIIKATSVTAFSGGVAVTPVTKQTGQSAVAVVRLLDTGLTTTGITAVQVLGNIIHGRIIQTTTVYFTTGVDLWDFTSLQVPEIQLAQNEIFGIRQTVTSVIGDNLIGTVDWIEA